MEFILIFSIRFLIRRELQTVQTEQTIHHCNNNIVASMQTYSALRMATYLFTWKEIREKMTIIKFSTSFQYLIFCGTTSNKLNVIYIILKLKRRIFTPIHEWWHQIIIIIGFIVLIAQLFIAYSLFMVRLLPMAYELITLWHIWTTCSTVAWWNDAHFNTWTEMSLIKFSDSGSNLQRNRNLHFAFEHFLEKCVSARISLHGFRNPQCTYFCSWKCSVEIAPTMKRFDALNLECHNIFSKIKFLFLTNKKSKNEWNTKKTNGSKFKMFSWHIFWISNV